MFLFFDTSRMPSPSSNLYLIEGKARVYEEAVRALQDPKRQTSSSTASPVAVAAAEELLLVATDDASAVAVAILEAEAGAEAETAAEAVAEVVAEAEAEAETKASAVAVVVHEVAADAAAEVVVAVSSVTATAFKILAPRYYQWGVFLNNSHSAGALPTGAATPLRRVDPTATKFSCPRVFWV